MESSNPVLREGTFAQARSYGVSESMSIQGVVNKSFVLFGILLISGGWIWGKLLNSETPVSTLTELQGYIWGGAIGGFVLALVTTFRPHWAKYSASLYAMCQGFALGGISAVMEMKYPGIAMQAVALTLGTLFSMLTLYKTKVIQATEKFKSVVFVATMAIGVVYLAGWLLSFFNRSIPYIHESGMIGIGFSLFVVGIAALNLIMDFDFIERNASQGVAKYMEWYSAFSLMVTIVWLYIEILRLLSKLRSRR